jgi:hypothetical protein
MQRIGPALGFDIFGNQLVDGRLILVLCKTLGGDECGRDEEDYKA